MGLGAETSILAKLHESLLRFAYDMHLLNGCGLDAFDISPRHVGFVICPISLSNAMAKCQAAAKLGVDPA